MLINLRVKTLDSQDHEFSVEDDVSDLLCIFVQFVPSDLPLLMSSLACPLDYCTPVQGTNSNKNRNRSRFTAAYLLRSCYE